MTNNEPDVSAVLDVIMAARPMMAAPMPSMPLPMDGIERAKAEHAIRRLAWQWRREGIAAVPCPYPTIQGKPCGSVGKRRRKSWLCDRCRELTVCDAALVALEVPKQ